jgi:hypothetical protein
MLQIYEKASNDLSAEDIGVKILPSIIPLMVTGNLSRHQFQEIMRSVKALLNKIETHKLATLPESSKSAIDSNLVDSKSAQLNDELAFLN